MSIAKNSLMRVGAAAILVALAFVLVAPAIQAATLLAIGDVQVSGSQVLVQVRNTTTTAISGYVQVQAVVDDATASSSAAFALTPGQKGSVSVPFCGPVSSVTQVAAIADSPTPY